MTAEHAIAFLLFAFVAAITPGPSNVMLTATGAAAGFVRGLPCLLGVAAGMGLLIFCVAMGLGQVVLGHDFALRSFNWLGAAFLLWLAWRIATAPPAAAADAPRPVGFAEAALFQWINPKSWLVSVSAVGTFLQDRPQGAWLQAALFAAVFLAAALPSGLAWLAFGASLQRHLRSECAARRFNRAMGAALALSVLTILL